MNTFAFYQGISGAYTFSGWFGFFGMGIIKCGRFFRAQFWTRRPSRQIHKWGVFGRFSEVYNPAPERHRRVLGANGSLKYPGLHPVRRNHGDEP